MRQNGNNHSTIGIGGLRGYEGLVKTTGRHTGGAALHDSGSSFISRVVGVVVGDKRGRSHPSLTLVDTWIPKEADSV